MKILTEQELKQTAEELGMDLSEVKTMYERAIANGSQLGLKEFQNYAFKENGGGANASKDEEEEDYMPEKVTKKELVAILADLTDYEWKELEQSMKIAQALKQDEEEEMDDEEEDMEEVPPPKMKGKKTKEQEAIEALQEQQKQMQDLMLQQTKALTGLAAAMVGGQQRSDLNAAVGDFFSTLPREQANTLLSSTKSGGPGTKHSDDTVLAKLKEFEERVGRFQNPGQDIYNMFTSQKLNGGK